MTNRSGILGGNPLWFFVNDSGKRETFVANTVLDSVAGTSIFGVGASGQIGSLIVQSGTSTSVSGVASTGQTGTLLANVRSVPSNQVTFYDNSLNANTFSVNVLNGAIISASFSTPASPNTTYYLSEIDFMLTHT